MSFEVNGNLTSSKRRKNREKQNSSTPKLGDFNIPNYANVHPGMNTFANAHIPEHAPYYFPVTYQPITTEPMSLPIHPLSYPQILQCSRNPNTSIGGYVNSSSKYNSLQDYSAINNNDATEYMSLPIGHLDQNETSSDKRRFSDPGVPFDSDSSSNSLDDRIVHKLTQQVNTLRESNRKLNREVADLRIELNMLKQHNMRHFDRDYEPGMLSDVIKEIRDAARVREDALLAKVKHMIEEKQFSMNQIQMASDKTRNNNDRISKLEEQLKNLNVSPNSRIEENPSTAPSSAIDENTNSARQVIQLEHEALVLRRELQDAIAKREEANQKLIQLEKKITGLLPNKEVTCSDISEDGKSSTSTDIFSVTTLSSGTLPVPQRVTLTGPVTDL